MSAKRHKFSDQIRRAIIASGKSRYRLAKETGIDTATLSRFIHRKGGLSIEAIDALADLLGWNLDAKAKSTKRRIN